MIRDKWCKSLMFCHQYFFGGKYDLIQLHRNIYVHEKFIATITTSIFHIFKENNEIDMAANGISFDLYYWPKPSQIGQKGLAAAADAPLNGLDTTRRGYYWDYWEQIGCWERTTTHEVHTVLLVTGAYF
jgi:hypothetical protein